MYLHTRWMAWKLNHPSPGERAVIAVLDELNVGYDREARFDDSYRTVDFLLHAPHADDGCHRKVIEVFGEPHVRFADSLARDEDKLRTLWSLGFEVLVIRHDQIGDVRNLVANFLK